MSIVRKRMSHEESRTTALEAARALLIEAGPAAVTLKAVSARMGRTHANLLHHFGSAAELQKALAGYLASQVCDSIAAHIYENRDEPPNPGLIVDMVFDAFDKGGAGALATWMILSGNDSALDPVIDAIHQLTDDIGEGHADKSMHEDTMMLVLMAMGDALLGDGLANALGLPRDAARQMAVKQLVASPRLAARLSLA